MYRQHFGLTHTPLGKTTTELWDDGALAPLQQRFDWLLQSPGIGLLTGAPGVGVKEALTLSCQVPRVSSGRQATDHPPVDAIST